MAGLEYIGRELTLATAGLTGPEIDRALAAFAKREVRNLISSGAAPSSYQRYVNGVLGAPEESVRAPGPIIYEFTNWPLVIRTAIDELQKRVPRKSGRYAASFLVLADGKPVADYLQISPNAEVTILNPQPYTRKMETGANRTGARHFDLVRRVLAGRFSEAFTVDFQFLKVGAGVHPLIPYTLRNNHGRRKDRQAGMPITYPAIVINTA